jgi:putative FmdB family regulatory protein
MPFYEYHCDKCGSDFEALVRTMSSAAPKCPKCGWSRVNKKLSVFGVGAAAPKEMSAGCQACPQGGSCPRAH